MKGPGGLVSRTLSRGLIGMSGFAGAQLLPQARLAGPVAWVMAIMVSLVTVAACGGLALSNVAQGARAEIAGGLTVQIVEALPSSRDHQARLAAEMLSRADGVASVRRVPDAELEALVAPWLGEAAVRSETVPIPALLDVRLDGPATPARLRALRRALVQVAPAARVEAQSNWLKPVFSAILSLQWLALALVVMLGLATAAAVWLSARTALGTNRETIEVVHHLGGTDKQIARIFERSVAVDAVLGGLAGLGIGLASAWLIGNRFAALESGMVARGALDLGDWLLVALIPAAGVALATVTARATVLRALRRML